MDDDYTTHIPGYNRRFEVMPGITDLAQVRGQRGTTDTMDKIAARIASDIEYVETHGFWGDLMILLHTVLAANCPPDSLPDLLIANRAHPLIP